MARSTTADGDQDTKTTSDGILGALKAGASRLADQGPATASGTMEAGRHYAERAYETGHRKAEEAAFYAELGYEEARDWARAHPGQALAIATGIGLLIGLMVARR